MNALIICHITGKSYFIERGRLVLPLDDSYITCNGHLVSEEDRLEDGKVYHIVPRLCGGKGGFGSMLRAIGAQIEKTTNHEACRDISGRRMRDVNNEKKLKEWLGKKAEKDREREREKQERRERRRAMPNHKFEDETYHEQKKKVAENLEDALLQGLQKVNKVAPSCTVTSASCSGGKRKADDSESGPSAKNKKQTEWLGIDIDELSDLDSDEDSTSPGNSSSQLEDDNSLPEPEQWSSSNNENSCDTNQSNDSIKPCNTITQSDTSNSNTCDKIPDIENGDMINEITEETLPKVNKKDETVGLLEALEKFPPAKKHKVEPEKETFDKDNDVNEPVNLDDYNSPEELHALGLERLKTALMSRKMKCGGNLEQRAERLFSVKGLSEDKIPSSLLAKPNKKK